MQFEGQRVGWVQGSLSAYRNIPTTIATTQLVCTCSIGGGEYVAASSGMGSMKALTESGRNPGADQRILTQNSGEKSRYNIVIQSIAFLTMCVSTASIIKEKIK